MYPNQHPNVLIYGQSKFFFFFVWELDDILTLFLIRLTKPKKSSQISAEQQKLGKSSPEHLHMVMDTDRQSKNASTDAPMAVSRSISVAARQLQEDDQLTVKGRHLLGKYYNGPTQWLVLGGSKFKGKQVLK
jgi:hypothetical protein